MPPRYSALQSFVVQSQDYPTTCCVKVYLERYVDLLVSMRFFLFHHLNRKMFLPALRVRQE